MARDIYSLLEEEHREVEKLFDRIERASEDRRRPLFDELGTALTVHSLAEAEVLYARLESNLPDEMAESRREHDEVDRLVLECRKIQGAGEDFLNTLQRLKEAVQAHVREEEHEIFPKARGILTGEQDALGKEYERRRGDLKSTEPTTAMRDRGTAP